MGKLSRLSILLKTRKNDMIDSDKEVSSMKEKDIQRETSQIVEDVLEKANLKQGSIFVLGLSSSEVIGGQIGKESSQEIGEIIVKTILDILEEKGIHLAVQGCEHVNRALVVERQVAERFGLESSVSFHSPCRRFRSVGSLQVYARSS